MGLLRKRGVVLDCVTCEGGAEKFRESRCGFFMLEAIVLQKEVRLLVRLRGRGGSWSSGVGVWAGLV